MDKVIEYNNYSFHLGYNDGSRESIVKFLNDEQTKHNGQIIQITASKVSNEEYLLHNIVFKSVDEIKNINLITGIVRKNISAVFIVDCWYACFSK